MSKFDNENLGGYIKRPPMFKGDNFEYQKDKIQEFSYHTIVNYGI